MGGMRVQKQSRFLVGIATGAVRSDWHEGNGRSLHQLNCAWTVCVPSNSEEIALWHHDRSRQTGLPKVREGDVIGIWLDCDAGTLTFTVNGVGGSDATCVGLPKEELFPVVSFGGDDVPGGSVRLDSASWNPERR